MPHPHRVSIGEHSGISARRSPTRAADTPMALIDSVKRISRSASLVKVAMAPRFQDHLRLEQAGCPRTRRQSGVPKRYSAELPLQTISSAGTRSPN